MKSKHLFFSSLITIVFLFGMQPSGFSTDGYFSLGFGTKSKGLAGAGIGLHNYSLIGGNPAGHAKLGTQYDIGISIFSPSRQYTITGNPSGIPGFFGLTPGTVESDSKFFPIPHLGANWMIGNSSSIGFSLYGNGGMNTNYPTQTFYDQSIDATGVNLGQMFGEISFSHSLSQNHSIGVSALVAYQYFAAEGLTAFGGYSSNPAKISNNGTDSAMGFGFKIGYLGELTSDLSIGAQFQSKVAMSEFEEYAGLYAEQGDFDVPMSWTAGLAYKFSDKLTMALDIKQIYYNDVASVGNSMDLVNNPPLMGDGLPNPNFQPLGTDAGWGFGWQDMTVYKIGLEYMLTEDWTIRTGYSYGGQPVPETEVLFNILAPGVVENHIAFGLSKNLASGKSIDFFINYAFNNEVVGNNPLDFDPVQLSQGNFVPNQEITIEMYQFDFGVGYSF